MHHHFSQAGNYETSILFTRNRDELVEGLHESHELVVLIDRQQIAQLTISHLQAVLIRPIKIRVSHAAVTVCRQQRFNSRAEYPKAMQLAAVTLVLEWAHRDQQVEPSGPRILPNRERRSRYNPYLLSTACIS